MSHVSSSTPAVYPFFSSVLQVLGRASLCIRIVEQIDRVVVKTPAHLPEMAL
jgi:hypothetical protein